LGIDSYPLETQTISSGQSSPPLDPPASTADPTAAVAAAAAACGFPKTISINQAHSQLTVSTKPEEESDQQ
jgi:hypothetical protein